MRHPSRLMHRMLLLLSLYFTINLSIWSVVHLRTLQVLSNNCTRDYRPAVHLFTLLPPLHMPLPETTVVYSHSCLSLSDAAS